jgi:hypothetical protein
MVTLYVAPAGTGNCAAGTPCGSIQQAITMGEGSAYNSDDLTIEVAGGTYTENDSINASSLHSLTIAGSGASATTVNGAGLGSVFTVNSGTVTLSGLTVTRGKYARGSGIDNSGTLTINSSTVSGNSDPGALGGGIYNSGTLIINTSTVSGNTASSGGLGGGIENNGGTLTINTSTVSENTAGVGGGISSNGSLTINSSTVSANTASLGGGISNMGTTTIAASIVASNTGSYGSPSCYGGGFGGSFASLGYNLTDDSTGTNCGFTQPTDVVGVSPDLGPLALYGGPTDTQLPAASSPAVGVISPNTTLGGVLVCPRTDQRGVASSGSCAIGAVEANTVSVTDPGNQTNTTGSAITPLTNSVTDSEPGAAFTWSVIGLPVGLSIDSATGTITGTPSTTCSCSVTLTATDGAGYHGSTTFTWTITNTVSVINPGAQSDVSGSAINPVQILASDSMSSATLSYSDNGTLPAGLSVDSSSGVISGTPTTAGSSAVTITVTDSQNFASEVTFNWTITNNVSVTNPGDQASTSGLPITPLPVVASDTSSVATLTFSATGLPSGLSIDPSSGIISGTPSMTESSSVEVTATDDAGFAGSTNFTWTVNPAGPQVVITTTSLPAGTLGQPYSFQLQATGGTPPYTWNKYRPKGMGTLPVGMGISRSGLISGTPKRAGTYTIAVKCLDSSHSHKTQGVQTLTLTINR